jgi:PAS domain S-box-containing protein
VFVWEVDAEGLYTYASTVVETILGYVPDELVGKLHFYDLFAPEVREQIKAVAIQGIAEKRPFQSFLASSLKKDGSTVMLEKSGTPMLDEAGNLIGYRGADRDVTGRVRAMEELRQHRDHLEQIVKERTAEIEAESSKLAIEVVERTLVVEAYKRSEARLQLQFDSMPLACITIGRNLKLQAWNPAAVRIFGYTATEAVGAPVIDLIVPEDIRPEVDALLRTLLEGKESVRNVNDNATKDGRRITCEWTNTPLLDPDRSRQGLLCMVEDITLRRQAEEGLKRKTVELEAFNKAMIGREKRLIELKEELNRLCLEVGRPPAYPPVWRDEDESADSP